MRKVKVFRRVKTRRFFEDGPECWLKGYVFATNDYDENCVFDPMARVNHDFEALEEVNTDLFENKE